MGNHPKEKALKAIEYFIMSREKSNGKRKEAAKKILDDRGITTNKWTLTQLHIIALLNKYPNQTNNTFLATEWGISKPAVSKAIKTLIAEKMIIERKRENEQKAIYYTLTPSGRELSIVHDEMHQIAEARYNQLLNQFSDQELEVIVRFLELLSNE